MIGCLSGTVIALAVAAHQAAPVLFGAPPGRPDNVGYVEDQLASLLGLRPQLAEILGLLRSNIVLVMGFVRDPGHGAARAAPRARGARRRRS